MGKFTSFGLIAAIAFMALFAGCTQGGNGSYQAPGSLPDQTGTGQQTAQASSGRAVMTISDAAADMGAVTSILVTVDSVSVHGTGSGWVTVSSTPATYDLLQLRASGAQALLANANLPNGSYDQIKLKISSVTVVDSNGSHSAKLPSGDYAIKGAFNVAANSTTALNLDVLADRSLHLAGNGKYVLAPVVHLTGTQGADVDVRNRENVQVRGGRSSIDVEVGMDENGDVGEGRSISSDANVTIGDDGKIRVGLGIGLGNGQENQNGQGENNGNGNGRPLFSVSQYATTAVEVYPANSNAGEVPNFDLATEMQSGGSVVVTMTEKAGGQKLIATVPAGGKLYFNDGNPGDDLLGQDLFLQDDKLIVVDSSGYIVQD
ncbi:Uncharacterised protein [uncultured archaeon]|nr:Uncharacterised protein [uncultured archaeon]